MTISIRARLFISAFFILVAFLGLTGVALDKGFQDSVETAVHGRLQAHVYTLLAAADLGERNHLQLPAQLPEPRLSSPDSGLVAMVSDQSGQAIWQSRSMLGIELPRGNSLTPGQWYFEIVDDKQGNRFIVASFVASWAGSDNELHPFRFLVAEHYRFTALQLSRFRRTLWTWLGLAGLILLAAQGSILRWSLSPLRKVESEITAIETGDQKQLSENYPRELNGLTRRLNALVENSEKHLQRYRDSLGNLAHSLKTPLAVLKNALDSDTPPEKLRATTDEQFQRMVEIIDHQLQRAATAGRSVLTEPVAVTPSVTKIINALKKVYAGKTVDVELNDVDGAVFLGDEGDLFELIGNLLDNAFKWCNAKIRIDINNIEDGNVARLHLVVDDDGPGIPGDQRERILKRGERADPDVDGHGLGLDMVFDTVQIYKGTLELLQNDWGGLRIEILL